MYSEIDLVTYILFITFTYCNYPRIGIIYIKTGNKQVYQYCTCRNQLTKQINDKF